MIDQTDEEVLRNEVSDEALEAAALAALGGFPTFRTLIASLVRAIRGVPGAIKVPLELKIMTMCRGTALRAPD
jgi:hypothetical protein